MRLIDADFLKRRINETMSSEYVYSTIGLKNLIEEAPTIAAEDVKHGKWRLSKYYPHIISCDVCGEPYELSNSMEHWNYCPHCGAKMDSNDSNDSNALNALNALEMNEVNDEVN